MRTLNLGILAHVDAGKTSLTERLLHAAGVIKEVGSVDAGSTQADSLALERRRGITIKSAVLSFVLDGVAVNLIDTPGHPDFIAEVERVLGVLDGAVLVVSAVEGVQPQTRVLMRTLRRLRIPTLIFVNKIDRSGAREQELVVELGSKLASVVLPMGRVTDLGTPRAAFLPYPADEKAHLQRLAEVLAEHDDGLLASYVEDAQLTGDRLQRALVAQTGRALVHPVFFGSAITGAGVKALVGALTSLLPTAEADTASPVAGTVFKVDRDTAGEKIAYVRMFRGSVHVRDRVPYGRGHEGKVTGIEVFDSGRASTAVAVEAGRIGLLRGLGEIRIGDAIGAVPATAGQQFAAPTLETVVLPRRAAERGELHAALVRLAEQDPLINFRQDEQRQEYALSLYGEVQKEVIGATLADEFGIEVDFRESTVICIERVTGTGSAVEFIGVEPNPFLGTVGLRIEPGQVDGGVHFKLGVELGSMPYAFIRAVEETVRETLQEGLRGWNVPDCTVTLTHSGYWARQSHAHGSFDKSMSSTAGDFRGLVPLVLMAALRRAGTRVCEPMHRFQLALPADKLGVLLPMLGKLRAVPRAQTPHGSGDLGYLIEGEIPAAQVHELQQALPVLTSGEGVLDTAFDHYQPMTGPVPERRRTDANPLNRKEYLLSVSRRV